MTTLRLGTLLCIFTLLTGCLYGQCLNGPCALERARMLRSIKAYGEHWIKPGMSGESWKKDWVACGGKPNGSYAIEAPDGSTTEVLQADSRRITKKLGACMQSKGYHYEANP